MVGALLAAYVFWCTCRAGCLDNVFVLYSSVDVLKLDSFSFGCLNVGFLPVVQSGVFPQLQYLSPQYLRGHRSEI